MPSPDEIALLGSFSTSFQQGLRDAMQRKALARQMDMDERYKQAQMEDMAATTAKKRAEIDWMNRPEPPSLPAGSANTPRPKRAMTPNEIMKLTEGAAVPNTLEEIKGTIEKNADLFSPGIGILRGANPWDERARTVDAQLRTASQQFGRYMEGGVLRKEDEDKYRRMFPSIGKDTPQVASNKLANIHRLLTQKYNTDIKTLLAQGYGVEGFPIFKPAAIPSAITRGPGKTSQAATDSEDTIEARRILENPMASPEDKAEAQRILGGK